MNKRVLALLLLLMTCACGSSNDITEPDRATVQAMIVTYLDQTKEAIPSPNPTFTPVPLLTVTLTPAPLPNPDPKAMIRWQALGLPEGYQSIDPASLGLGVGDVAFSRQLPGGASVTYLIEGGFVFADAWPVGVYGYSVLLPTDGHRQAYDMGLTSIDAEMKTIVSDVLMASEYSEPETLIDATQIGDRSRGVEVTYSKAGQEYHFYHVRFRVGEVGGNVFIRHLESEKPVISAADLANIYAESIMYPEYSCRFIDIQPVEDRSWPEFDIHAQGFYPGEGRMIAMRGDLIVGGETRSATTAFMGLEGQSADQDGQIIERVMFGLVEGEGVIPPSELEIEIQGYHSGCIVNLIVPW